jgi:transglutaminase-like putative cysteine protease
VTAPGSLLDPAPVAPQADALPSAAVETDVAGTVLAGLSVVAAGVAWWRVYPPSALPVPILLGAALGAAAALLAGRVRDVTARTATLALAVPVAAALAGLGSVAAATPRLSPVSGQAPGALRDALVGGLHRILTTTLPAPPTPDLLPQLAVLAALAAGAAVALARRGAGVAAYLPGAVLLAAGLACGVSGAGRPLLVVTPFALVTAVGVLGRRRPVALVAALAVVAAGLGGGLAAGQLATGRSGDRHEPMDPRTLTPAPLRVSDPASPLDQLAGWLLDPGRIAFTGTVDGTWRSVRPMWRLAAFDRYDGLRWSAGQPAVSIGYEISGASLTAAGAGPAPRRETRVTVDARELGGVFVPMPGPLRRVDRPGLAYDLTGQTLVDPDGAAGHRYRARVRLPDLAPDRLAGRRPQLGADSGPELSLPSCRPDELVAQAQRLRRPGQSPLQLAVTLETWLARQGGFVDDPNAASGHSCGRLSALLQGDRRGTPEQFATAYVVMARSVGLPTRLVVGFRPGRVDAAGTVLVRYGDATAWPEVRLEGAGWVPLDPTPTSHAGKADEPSSTVSVVRRAGAPEPDPTAAGAGADRRPPTPAPVPPTPRADSGTGRIVIGVLVVLGLLALGPPALLVAKAVRRRSRRRRGGALGAWAELLDRLAERGRAPDALTTGEVRRLVGAEVPAAAVSVRPLLAEVDAAVYAQADGSEGAGPDPAWAALAATEADLRRATPWSQRVRQRLRFVRREVS